MKTPENPRSAAASIAELRGRRDLSTPGMSGMRQE
jgi:hypothetical protein